MTCPKCKGPTITYKPWAGPEEQICADEGNCTVAVETPWIGVDPGFNDIDTTTNQVLLDGRRGGKTFNAINNVIANSGKPPQLIAEYKLCPDGGIRKLERCGDPEGSAICTRQPDSIYGYEKDVAFETLYWHDGTDLWRKGTPAKAWELHIP